MAINILIFVGIVLVVALIGAAIVLGWFYYQEVQRNNDDRAQKLNAGSGICVGLASQILMEFYTPSISEIRTVLVCTGIGLTWGISLQMFVNSLTRYNKSTDKTCKKNDD